VKEQVTAAPQPAISVVDTIAIIVGIVLGAGIFRLPSLVAGNGASEGAVLLAWTLGGLISIAGALVYAEMATAYPHAGGDYHFLMRAFGRRLSFLFGWARMSVIQTGAIAALGFVFGDYATEILSLGAFSSAIYAVAVVAILTALNVIGIREGTRTQNLFTILEVAGVILVIGVGLTVPAAAPNPAAAAAAPPPSSSLGLMMVFVLFTYGGWNEAAYVSAELRDVKRNMARALVVSLLIVTALYVTINWVYLRALGLAGAGQSQQIAADVLRLAGGDAAARAISVLVAIAALTSLNATILTGGRSSYAFGRDFRAFGFLGDWSTKSQTPARALVIQGAIALVLVLLGAMTRDGLTTAIDFTAPVFWLFFLLTGVALFVLRLREPQVERPFRVPLFPITPFVFCAAAAYLLYSSLAYARVGALAGVGVLAVGGAILLFIEME
jgi:amino acid transporter